MTTFHWAFESSTAFRKRWSCGLPRKVRWGLLILFLHACETGWASDGIRTANRLRVVWGAVGARSGSPVEGLSQTPLSEAFAARKERSSRKKSSRFLPQRKVR